MIPDKILVGEIRDLETAQIAVQAALTGHTVFSTLHTNDAPSTIVRMRDMGLQPFLITATVECVLAQRLVRRVCADCPNRIRAKPRPAHGVEPEAGRSDGQEILLRQGLRPLQQLRLQGPHGAHELYSSWTTSINDLIFAATSLPTSYANPASRPARTTATRAGLNAIYSGQTSIDEIVRETILEE